MFLMILGQIGPQLPAEIIQAVSSDQKQGRKGKNPDHPFLLQMLAEGLQLGEVERKMNPSLALSQSQEPFFANQGQ
jgi:hypothetical protein